MVLSIFNFNGDSIMEIDVTIVLKNLEGVNLIEPDSKGEVSPVTLRAVFLNSLMRPVEKDTGVQKVEKYAFAIHIQKTKIVDFTPEQIVLLKEVVGPAYSPLVVGPVFAILDGKESE